MNVETTVQDSAMDGPPVAVSTPVVGTERIDAIDKLRGIAVAGIVVLAVHALADFSAQIQAVAMAYAMIMGVGAAQSHSRSGSSRRIRSPAPSTKFCPESVKSG